MTDIDRLERDIAGLKRLLSLAWSHLARNTLTIHERREMRNEMSLRSQELRDRLGELRLAMQHLQREADARLDASRIPPAKLRLLQAA